MVAAVIIVEIVMVMVIKNYRCLRVGCKEQLMYFDFAKSFSMYNSIIRTPRKLDGFNTLLHMQTLHF